MSKQKKTNMSDLLDPSEDRYVLHPIKYPDIFKMGKDAIDSFWKVEELDFQNDKKEFDKMKPEEQHFIKQILGFFASADGIVIENLVDNFCSEVQLPEARYFYGYQNFNEQIHAETYAKLLEVYVGSYDDVRTLLNETKNSPAVKAKTDFAKKHFNIPEEEEPDRYRNFAKRLIAFACVEGINFSSSFCGIFWIKYMGYQCNALTLSNEFISRDEGLHRNFAVRLYNKFLHNLTAEEITSIVIEAVRVEEIWVRNSALPENLTGMNQDLMCEYVRHTANILLNDLHVAPYWDVQNPFDFMNQISIGSKTNFFEKRVSEYALSNKKEEFSLDEEF
jgi:ribonucleotide reductase beta subunit family protein with ferritin-like domain